MFSKTGINTILKASLYSYSQVFFSDNKLFAVILLLVSFIDPGAGLAGFASALVTNVVAYELGFNRSEIKKGLYGFNSLLVGLGIGYYFELSFELYIIVFIASILTLFFVTFLKGIFQKYGLPYLSFPFLFGIWTIIIATYYFEALGLSQRGIFTINKVYALGGAWAVNLLESFGNIPINSILKTYFTSIGAIFFQFSVIPGIIISIGLLLYSRIAFLLSVYGFSAAYLFYHILGGNIADLSYSYIGFNYILTAIAVGGFFMIPSKHTFLWLLVLIPLVTLITLSLSEVFSVFKLSIYSLPFNIVVLLFIYALKFRVTPSDKLSEVFIQQNSPEKNLYSFNNQKKSHSGQQYLNFQLPFYGKWKVMQGHDGEYTHKEDWKYAWDFIITDENDDQFKNRGDFPHDYFCYGKSVLAPSSGIVIEIIDDIPDNDIGKVNLYNNWGNSVIIKHAEYLYSSHNHLKPGSIIIKEGDKVKAGQKIGEVGNSGRSAYPHLHFQFQSTPYIGSKTLYYPFAYFISKGEENIRLLSFDIPLKDMLISNPDKTALLSNRLQLIPGQVLKVSYSINEIPAEEEWEVYTSPSNQSYIYDKNSESLAFFIFDGNMFYFTHFTGEKSCILYHFYLGLYKVFSGYYKNLILKAEIPQNKTFSFPLLTLQDFIAPFYMFLKTEFWLYYKEADNNPGPELIKAESRLTRKVFNLNLTENKYEIIITEENISLKINNGKIRLNAQVS
jgi:urea transporter